MINKINKWLTKLFDKRIVSNEEYNVMMEGNAVYMSRVTDLMVIKSVNDYSVWVRKGGLNILIGEFNFNRKSEESIKYAKVCAEDLVDALRDAEQYEPIK